MDTDQLLLALEGAEAKKPEASGEALVALEAEVEKPVKPVRKSEKKGGITDELLGSLPAVEVVLVSEEVRGHIVGKETIEAEQSAANRIERTVELPPRR